MLLLVVLLYIKQKRIYEINYTYNPLSGIFLSKGWVLEAQPKAAYCPIPNRSVGKIKVIDSTIVKIWYAFNADNINDENTYIDKQCLDIGKKS